MESTCRIVWCRPQERLGLRRGPGGGKSPARIRGRQLRLNTVRVYRDRPRSSARESRRPTETRSAWGRAARSGAATKSPQAVDAARTVASKSSGAWMVECDPRPRPVARGTIPAHRRRSDHTPGAVRAGGQCDVVHLTPQMCGLGNRTAFDLGARHRGLQLDFQRAIEDRAAEPEITGGARQ